MPAGQGRTMRESATPPRRAHRPRTDAAPEQHAPGRHEFGYHDPSRPDRAHPDASRHAGLQLRQLAITRPDGAVTLSPGSPGPVTLDPVAPGAADLTFRRGAITLLTGLSGAGTTALCRSVAGTLPHGWRLAGDIRLAGTQGPAVSLRGLSARDLAPVVGSAIADDIREQVVLRPAGLETVREVMVARSRACAGVAGTRHGADEAADAMISQLGLAAVADRPAWGLAQASRWALAAGAAVVGSPAVVVLDSLLGVLGHTAAAGLARAVTALAARGATVIWSEHRLAPVAAIADDVVELAGHDAYQSPIGAWQPRAQPRPALMALVDGLGLDHDLWTSPERINRELAPRVRTAFPSAGAPRRTPVAPAHPAVRVEAAQLGLRGPSLEFNAGERVGVLCATPDEARLLEGRLARALGAPRRVDAQSLLRRRPMARACAAWDELHPGSQTMALFAHLLGAATRLPAGPLRVASMSGGQRDAATTAMALAGTGPAVLADPGSTMDAAMIGRLADHLAADSPLTGPATTQPRARAVVFVGDNPDVMAQLCERTIEVRHGAIVQDVGVLAAQADPRTRATLARACAPLRVVQVSDALAALSGTTPGGPLVEQAEPGATAPGRPGVDLT
ncbi:ABC transporter, ATP-binding protein [Propionibacterium freudenreichii]|nr:ABC transporter, ATP-binding protein [Propionibacterium freudenreichii]CEI24763.1 ABC transporter, ATP-binding protein [Propionibacterium freudenreichii]